MTAQNSQYEFDAIGTHWWIERLDNTVMTTELNHALLAAAELFNTRYSRFRDDSLIAELARTGKLDNAPEEMIRMLEFARQLFRESEGVFNITVGGALHALGYGSREHAANVLSEPWSAIHWHGHSIVAPVGLMLDFGGFGKGWLIETFADIMRTHGVQYFLINGGGDLYVDAQEPVEFALENPFDSTQTVGQTRIKTGALAASSSLKRTWQHEGVHHHHIIDPKTEESSDSDVVASFVRADSALIADTVATIIMIRPSLEKSLKRRYNLQTILVHSDDLQ